MYLVTVVSNTGRSFIIDGRRLKSINQWYSKGNARLQSIKDSILAENPRTDREPLPETAATG